MTLRLVLVGDHPVVLQGLRALLVREPELDVVAVCTDGRAAVLDAVKHHEPDVLVMDAAIPGVEGLEALDGLRADGPRVPTVVLAASLADETLLGLLESGVEGLLLKESSATDLVDAVRAVTRGERWIGTVLTGRVLALLSGEETEDGDALTPREREVSLHVANGLSNKRVADRLDISVSTVKHHLRAVFGKLGVANRTQLSLLARERDWI